MEKKYEVINFKNRSFSAIYHKDVQKKNAYSYLHWHESPELIYIRSKTYIYYNGEEILGNPGDLIFINSNVIHSFKSAEDENAVYDCLILDVNLCNFFGFDVENKFIEKIITDKKVSGILEELIFEIKEGKDYYVSAIKFLIGQLLVYLYRNYETEVVQPDNNKKTINLIKNIISYIEENFKNNINLDDISNHSGYSKYYIIHAFKKSTGITILDFINTLRIKEAVALLENKSLSINEIALAAGFENQSYFSKVFKKYMGVSPSKYIDKQRN